MNNKNKHSPIFAYTAEFAYFCLHYSRALTMFLAYSFDCGANTRNGARHWAV